MRPTTTEVGLVSKLKLDPHIGPTESYNEQHVEALDRGPSAISELAPDGPYLGTYYLPDAPLRAKLTLPHEPGTVLVIKGRVWGNDTRDPLPRAKLDVWHADATGHYDNENEGQQSESQFLNRARVYTDQGGYYEFETIHPGPYERPASEGIIWRAPHIHFRVRCPGYENLVTQIFFTGDSYHDVDPFLKASLVIKLETKQRNGKDYEEGIFDIVMRPDSQT